MLHDLNIYIVGRLLLASALGGIIGLERQLRHKPAGLRTNMLISSGAALFTIISYQMAATVGGDHTRIAAQIIPGIGFIGAGVVIRDRGAVTGITSAATIFVMASIGMACGAAMPVTAIFATLLMLVSLVILGAAEERFGLDTRRVAFRITAPDAGGIVESMHQVAARVGIDVRRWQSHKTDGGFTLEFAADVTLSQERDLLAKLAAMGVRYEARPLQQ
ncbi:MAG: MgtC/SapB family protein [Candidatus Acidiferrales bacterium]